MLRPTLLLLALAACVPEPPTDADEDGYGTIDEGGRDCDDADNDIHPGVVELCNGEDDDCDGVVDEDASDSVIRYPDADGDGFGLTEHGETVCIVGEEPTGMTELDGDCDDGDAEVYPEATEICDDIDNDCDDAVDEEVTTTWALDEDGDGYGGERQVEDCEAPSASWVTELDDCDDADPLTYPDAPSLCDGEDRDCDGLVDDDADGDGFADATCGGDDCDDADTGISPDAVDVSDGVDNDCDGVVDHTAAEDLGSAVAGTTAYGAIGGAFWAGDVDGDGQDELFVGSATDDAGAAGGGAAWLVQGPVSGLTAALSIEGEADGDGLGGAVFATDLDGDDYAELVVGMPGAETDAGAVWVMSGSLTGTVGSADATAVFTGVDDADRAGSSFAVLERDGATWLAIGAPGVDGGDVGGGAIYLVPGTSTGTTSLADATYFDGYGRYGYFGSAIAIGDIDGDGDDDVIGGTPGNDRVSVFLASDDAISDEECAAILTGSDSAGGALAAGDVDGDGYDDLLIGASEADDRAGAAWLMMGPMTGAITLADSATLSITGADAHDGLGTSVMLHDIDGDGTLDIALGAPGRAASGVDAGTVALWSGPLTGEMTLEDADALISGDAGDQLGTALGLVDDWLAVGAPGDDEGGTDAGAIWLLDPTAAWGGAE